MCYNRGEDRFAAESIPFALLYPAPFGGLQARIRFLAAFGVGRPTLLNYSVRRSATMRVMLKGILAVAVLTCVASAWASGSVANDDADNADYDSGWNLTDNGGFGFGNWYELRFRRRRALYCHRAVPSVGRQPLVGAVCGGRRLRNCSPAPEPARPGTVLCAGAPQCEQRGWLYGRCCANIRGC
jgi:hypothetical protein